MLDRKTRGRPRISLRLDPEEIEALDEAAERRGFEDRSGLIRHALRPYLTRPGAA